METIFTLPRSLFLRMMRALHLHELDCLVARLALRSLKNMDRTLWLRKTRTELDCTQINCMLRLLETLLQLRHMEHIMHHR